MKSKLPVQDARVLDSSARPYINAASEPQPGEIAVEQPSGGDLADGEASVAFGKVLIGGTVTRDFVIRNVASGTNLTGLGITIDGPDAAYFTVTANPAAPVSGPGGSTTFTVAFTPNSPGTKMAALHIASNDTDENPFDIALTGTGLTALENWRLTHFETTENSGDAADSADPDSDGVKNLLEFAFGCAPKVADAEVVPRIICLANSLRAEVTEPAGVTDITYGAQWSEDMVDWFSSGIEHGIVGETHTFTLPITGEERLFMRLRVSSP